VKLVEAGGGLYDEVKKLVGLQDPGRSFEEF
jgi:hypothetical protein